MNVVAYRYLHCVEHENPAIAGIVLPRGVVGRAWLCDEQLLACLVAAAELAYQVHPHRLSGMIIYRKVLYGKSKMEYDDGREAILRLL